MTLPSNPEAYPTAYYNILEDAVDRGRAEFEFPSKEEAERTRFSLYRLRRALVKSQHPRVGLYLGIKFFIRERAGGEGERVWVLLAVQADSTEEASRLDAVVANSRANREE